MAATTKTAAANLDKFLEQVGTPDVLLPYMRQAVARRDWTVDVTKLAATGALLKRPPEVRAEAAVAAAKLLVRVDADIDARKTDNHPGHRAFARVAAVLTALLRGHPPLTAAQLAELVENVARAGNNAWGPSPGGIVAAAERCARDHGLGADLRAALTKLRKSGVMTHGGATEASKLRARITALLDEEASSPAALPLKSDEPWATAVADFVAAVTPAERKPWVELLRAAKAAPGSAPSGKYLKHARELIDAVGVEPFKRHLCGWMTEAAKPNVRRVPGISGGREIDAGVGTENADVLKGLIWAAASLDDPELAAPIADFAEACYTKLRMIGPRCPKAGNACVAALAAMTGDAPAAQLTRLKQRVKQPSGRKMAEKALAKFAGRAGLLPEEVEERSVPTYGLAPDGTRTDKLGDVTVRTAIVAGDIEVTWTGADGKPRATVPAAVKQKHAARLKELQGVHKQLRTALSAHRDRIERLLLARRTIPLSTWRTCYVNHPVVGAIARRLIWSTDDTSFVAQGGELRDSASRAMKVESDAPVALWHPVGRPVGEVLAWRERLEALGVSQPFKQAHREVYLLTDAERRTATYSNRFAAHVLRQHQFHALAGQRGWRYTLMGTWDSHNTPELVLPKWGVRVEFWLDSAGGGTSPSGVFLHVSTDQVRFLATDADAARRLGHTGGVDRPLRLDRVPPLLLSEVMRDVDLFVGVASVGNDPAWQDGGPGGAFRTYWHEYSFGDLSENAKTRRAVLERLVPRLKIADRASLTDRFLVVRGDVRTYKIHLGSGNILMEPNDQYLCIVPDQSGRARGDDGVFLPFEGDATLSVILSKAFLLADDARITDKTITSQIRR